MTTNGEFILAGNAQGHVSVLSLCDLSEVLVYTPSVPGNSPHNMLAGSSVQALATGDNDRYLYCGSEMTPLMVGD